MIQKYFSKKLLTLIGTAAIDICVTVGILPAAGRESFVLLINALSGVYVIVQGVIDMIHATKGI